MLRIRCALGSLLLLGTLLSVAGVAAALTNPGELVCNTLFETAWREKEGAPVDPAATWTEGMVLLTQVGWAVGNGIEDARATLPELGLVDVPEDDRIKHQDQICVHFLSICGPILEMADRL